MNIRRATPEDYLGICELATAYYRPNLSIAEQRNGFLSVQFSVPQVAAIARDLGIIVARDGNRVVGFACASRSDADDQPAIVANMVAQLSRLVFQGRSLDDYRVFVYGPVLIEAGSRGRGLLRAMYHRIQEEVAELYDMGAAFVAEDNPRSFNAHVGGLGMSEVGMFTHANRNYHILAFPVMAGCEAMCV